MKTLRSRELWPSFWYKNKMAVFFSWSDWITYFRKTNRVLYYYCQNTLTLEIRLTKHLNKGLVKFAWILFVKTSFKCIFATPSCSILDSIRILWLQCVLILTNVLFLVFYDRRNMILNNGFQWSFINIDVGEFYEQASSNSEMKNSDRQGQNCDWFYIRRQTDRLAHWSSRTRSS